MFNTSAPLLLWHSRDYNVVWYSVLAVIGVGFVVIAVAPESPAYLLKKGEITQFHSVMRYIGKLNCAHDQFSTPYEIPLPPGVQNYSIEEQKEGTEEEEKDFLVHDRIATVPHTPTVVTPSLRVLLSNEISRRSVIIITLAWGVVTFSFYLL